ncbi:MULTISPECIES: hypothetical protein [unclassified Neorhizobium]|uniref:hypothetical protein n=1 Tax=unclassified Neorhizobium TaxID=2629175 RepID=UPI001FF155AF|nr:MULTISPECIES: hypothetical protein [unclassified Neorhizobium]MCJ9670070.1 hypothetical protein [Neorhizobium sp. SHOUNA12B]MCJ9746055.1 hypothetical protein [Neorhizobium sp. SHOUNA12A]
MSRPDTPFLVTLALVYLWGGLALDVVISILAWSHPGLWFSFFHDAAPQGLEVALLRRAAGQWTAFALAQALALIFFRRQPVWFAIMAGIRLSDVFTDLFYLLSAQPLTLHGWLVLAPLPLVNAAGVVLLLRCHALLGAETSK